MDVRIGGVSTAVVKVANTGSVAGKDVVELYAQLPNTQGGLEKAAIQLVNFGKIDVLQPRGSAELSIEFDAQYFASYDEDLIKADGSAGAWAPDAGDDYFAVGNGAHNALNNVPAAKTGSADDLISINGDEVIIPENAIKWTLAETDSETYSANVQNALQHADLNKLIPDAVEYTTRADWTSVTDMGSNRAGLSTFFTEQPARENGLRAFRGSRPARARQESWPLTTGWAPPSPAATMG